MGEKEINLKEVDLLEEITLAIGSGLEKLETDSKQKKWEEEDERISKLMPTHTAIHNNLYSYFYELVNKSKTINFYFKETLLHDKEWISEAPKFKQ